MRKFEIQGFFFFFFWFRFSENVKTAGMLNIHVQPIILKDGSFFCLHCKAAVACEHSVHSVLSYVAGRP